MSAIEPVTATSAVHLTPLSLDASGATPWDFSPLWFTLLAFVLPLLLWAALAWKRVLEEDPYRLRRAGRRQLRRLLSRLQRAGGAPRTVDLHAWFQAAARTWGLRVSTPTENEFSHALSSMDGDARWHHLWSSAERHLYAAASPLPAGWVQETAGVAKDLRIPPREHWFPTRARHWLPSLLAVACACVFLASPGNGLQAADAQEPANEALRADWNNWAAHYNIAIQQMNQGNAGYAVAHLTSAFLQRPSSAEVQDNLRWSFQHAGSMDPTLRRLLYGAWFQRYPVLLSPASWQRLGLFAALLVGSGLCVLVWSLYTNRQRRRFRLTGSWIVAAGIALFALTTISWNAWGDLHRPNVAMLVEGINLSPAPTDLVKDRETLPMKAGSIALIQVTFLGWKQVELPGPTGGSIAGWARSPYVMPLYATH